MSSIWLPRGGGALGVRRLAAAVIALESGASSRTPKAMALGGHWRGRGRSRKSETVLRAVADQPDQYWSALMISPPARVTRAAINWTDAMSLMKWTEPSTNRALAPPG